MKLLYLLICRVTSLAGWFGSDWSKGFGSPFFFFFLLLVVVDDL
jgi:hypothetical protein